MENNTADLINIHSRGTLYNHVFKKEFSLIHFGISTKINTKYFAVEIVYFSFIIFIIKFFTF